MTDVFIGCGSNIDARLNLRWAIRELEHRFGGLRCSPVYRSPAFGFDGPDFLNLVIAFDTEADADSVEAVLSDLENARGRDDADRSGSRTLDLDLLLQGDRVDAARRLPRDDILRYPFVLAPLAELSPGLIHPVTGVAIGDAWKECAKGEVMLTDVGALDAA
jgi:2-amino-4-hydroxy-6-hydroxymethyldihydropteridine diphosphokinase